MENSIGNNPYYKAACEYIRTHDLSAMRPGHYEIDGDNLYVNIVDTELKPACEARLEAHDRYIDVQIPLSCTETFGVKARKECTMPRGEMDIENDIIFFGDSIETLVNVRAGEMIVFPPDTAHAPLIGTGRIRKAIFKVKAC